MITPPNGSADESGMNDRVSSAPRQRYAFTPSADPWSWPDLLFPNRLRSPNRLPVPGPELKEPVSWYSSLPTGREFAHPATQAAAPTTMAARKNGSLMSEPY